MLKQYVLVNEEGFMLDVVLLDSEIDEITDFHISQISEGLFLPKWDFESSTWVEGLSAEEVERRRLEIEEQQNNQPPTIEELMLENSKLKERQTVLEGALIEIAQILL